MAILTVLENATAVAGLKECWKHRLQILKKEMGSVSVPILETATDPAGSSRLAEIEPRRVKVFESDETLHFTYAWCLLGEPLSPALGSGCVTLQRCR